MMGHKGASRRGHPRGPIRKERKGFLLRTTFPARTRIMKDLYGKKQRPAAWAPGRRNGMANNNFKKLLKKYISIKGLDIVVYLEDGKIIELNKNRALVKNEIVIRDKNDREYRIQLSAIRSVELYAA